jgi:Glycosyl transferase family 2/SEC-C motif
MKRPVAAITMVFNEAIFLPIWLNHYGSALGYENLFVIDDGSNDGSIRNDRIVNLVSRKRGLLDERERAKTISYFHEELLQYYDVVLYADADELIVPEPNLEISLKDYLIASKGELINTIGLNVLHHRAREGPLDLTKPLFSQRAYVQFDELYCKPVIARVPMRWTPGFHFCARSPCYATDLYLFHLRAMDYDISRAKIKNLNAVSFSEDSLRHGYGFYFRMPEQEYLDLFFATPEAEFAKARSELDFSAELPRINKRPGIGPIARVPSRFRNAIELTTADAVPGEGVSATSDLDAGRLYSTAIARMTAQEAPASRNAMCPCGSGKRFKHCHGLLAQVLPASR